MSRDHYKGIPKTRDAVIKSDGSLVPLSKNDSPTAVRVEVRTVRTEEPKSIIRIYARATGNDSTGDGSLENPYRTFYRCMDDVPLNSDGRVIYIDISGIGTEVVEKISVVFPPIVGGGGLYSVTEHPLPEFEAAGNNFYREGTVNIVASPTVVHSFTPSSITSDSETLNRNFVKTGAGWAADEFKGKFITNFSGPMFAIHGNTSDTIKTTCNVTLTGAVSIVEPSATLMYGIASKVGHSSFTPNFDMSACKTSFTIWGVSFKSPDGLVALEINAIQPVNINGCSIEGIFLRGCDFIEFDGVHFTPTTYVLMGGPTVYTRYSFFNKLGYFEWGPSSGPGAHVMYNSVVDGCSDFPHLIGDAAYSYEGSSMTINNTTVVSGTGNGIQASSLGVINLDRVSVSYCAGNGVSASENANLVINRLYGTGNSGYGVRANNGAVVVRRGTTTPITGTLGDFKIGVLPPDSWTNFNAGFKATLDTTAVSGTLSRMYNPSVY